MNLLRIFIVIIIVFTFNLIAAQRKCYDYLALEGYENLVTYGMDTTQNWWAITQPFADQYRLTVNGEQTDVFREIKQLTFSPDGNKWACFVKDNVQWSLLTNDSAISVSGNDVGDIQFSPSSNYIVYSFFESFEEIVMFKGNRIRALNRASRIYLSYNAERYAWKSQRGNSYILNVSGRETDSYDDIIPIGFWTNGQMVYAVKNGDFYEVYRGNESISEIYANITETAINLRGNVAAVLATEQSGLKVGILFSDDYYEPLIGNRYSNTYNLKLHPELPLLAYNARYQEQDLVVMNTAEYYGGSEQTGMPSFTYDGEDLYFLGCDLHCFVNINGRKYPMNSELPIDRTFARQPESNTIAYSTSSSMIIRNIENDELYAGIMVDYLISPRYNWRANRYETLGSIGNRLYLMTCSF